MFTKIHLSFTTISLLTMQSALHPADNIKIDYIALRSLHENHQSYTLTPAQIMAMCLRKKEIAFHLTHSCGPHLHVSLAQRIQVRYSQL